MSGKRRASSDVGKPRRYGFVLPGCIAAISTACPHLIFVRNSGSMRLFRLAVLILCSALLPPAPAAEHRITPEQEQQLFHSIDDIIKFISSDLKLPTRVDVKRELISREKLREAVETQFSSPRTKNERVRSEAVLRKLGLIPRDYDITEFAKNTQSDQVLGMYSPKAKTIYIVDSIDVGQQSAVLAHEVMHAIQDQTVNLREYVSARPQDAPPLDDTDEDVYDPSYDDGRLARLAVIEGEAMVAMYDYVVDKASNRVLFPGESARNNVRSALDAAFPHPKLGPIWQNAPLYLKDDVTFPYNQGFKFVWKLKQDDGPQVIAKLLKDPPRSTQELLDPSRYKRHHQDEEPFRAPKLAALVAPLYVPLQVTTMGEFDVNIFLQQFAGNGKAARIAPKWNGGVLFAARKKESTIEKLTMPDVAFAYVSRWQDHDTARRFAEAWSAAIPKRYHDAKQNGNGFASSEGPVTVEQRGDIVLVVESFPLDISQKIRGAVFKQ